MKFVLLIWSTKARTSRWRVTCLYSVESFFEKFIWILPGKNLRISISILWTLRSRVLLTVDYLSNVGVLKSYRSKSTLIRCWGFIVCTRKSMRICINSVFHLQGSSVPDHFLDKVLNRVFILSSSIFSWKNGLRFFRLFCHQIIFLLLWVDIWFHKTYFV